MFHFKNFNLIRITRRLLKTHNLNSFRTKELILVAVEKDNEKLKKKHF